MYAQRNYILENEDIHSVVKSMFERLCEDVVNEHSTVEGKKELIDYESIVSAMKSFGTNFDISAIQGKTKDECLEIIKELSFKAYENKIEPFKAQVLPVEKTIVLRTIDRAWVNHIDIMSKLRDGIHLRSYAQNNPLQAYVEEGFELFEEMMNTISRDVVIFCNNLKIITKAEK